MANTASEATPLLRRPSDSPPPTRRVHTPEQGISFFTGLFQSVMVISTFGASITFTVVVADLAEPFHHKYTTQTVRDFLSAAWLLFILALASAAILEPLLVFYEKEVRDGFRDGKRKYVYGGIVVSFFVEAVMIAAWIVLSLAVLAYSPEVGYVSIGFASAFGLLSLVLLVMRMIARY